MEKIKFILLILLTSASIVIVSGCSKDSKNSNPVTPGNSGGNGNPGNVESQASVFVNGEGFDLLQLNTKEGAAYYSPVNNSTYTSIVVRTGSDTLMILLATRGKETGTFKWNDSDAISYLIVASENGYKSYVSVNSGETKITEYGSVNGLIKGTFSGSVFNDNNNPVDIDGSFAIKRIKDQ